MDAAVGDDRGDQLGRRDVERRVVDGDVRRARSRAAEAQRTSSRTALLDEISRPSRVAAIDRARRRGDVERHAVMPRGDRER